MFFISKRALKKFGTRQYILYAPDWYLNMIIYVYNLVEYHRSLCMYYSKRYILDLGEPVLNPKYKI